tara:strand:- start:409 stop:699 length:291 start_codon:yes stop_codon:yes gene_type:complete
MNRKQRRMRKKALKKSKVDEKAFENKMGLFDLIPEDCMLCHAKFDKTSKDMARTWQVTVREKEKIVRVYCPSCWSKAQNLLNELGINNNEEQKRQD